MTLLNLGVNAQPPSAELRLAPVPSVLRSARSIQFCQRETQALLPAFSVVTKSSAVPQSAQVLLSSSWLSVCTFLPMGK